MKKPLLISVLLFATSAYGASAKIFQLHLNQHRVFGSMTHQLPEGTAVTAVFADGKTCTLVVKKTTGRNASLDTSSCAQEKQLYVGQALMEEGSTPDVNPAEQPKSERSTAPHSSATNIADLMYEPADGHGALVGAYTVSTGTGNISENGSSLYDIKTKETLFAATGEYTFMHSMTIGLTLGTGSSSYEQDVNGVNAETDNSSGMIDPALNFNYRMMDQDTTPMTFDIGVIYSPKGGNAQAASGTQNANNLYRGGDEKGFSAAIGQKRDQFQYEATFSYLNYGARKTTNAATAYENDYGSFSNMVVAGKVQYQLTEFFYVNGMVDEQIVGAQSNSSANGTPGLDKSSYNQTDFGVGAFFTAIPGRLGLSLNFVDHLQATINGTNSGIAASGTQSGNDIAFGLTAEF